MAKTKGIPQHSLVEILWEDASSAGPWMDSESVTEFLNSPPIMSSSGYILHVDKSTVLLSTTMAPDGSYAGVWRIPAGMVRSMTVIRRAKA